MGAGMGMAGGALALGGGLLNYYGQMQGAKAMQAEADRQAAEQGRYGVQRQQQLSEALGKYRPEAATNAATADLVRRGASINPTLAAGGEALGLAPSSVGSVGQAIMPMQRVAAQRTGQGVADTRHRALFDAAGRNMEMTDESARAAASLYPMRTNAAGSKGAMFRTGGEMMQGAGMATMVAAMNQAPKAPAGKDFTPEEVTAMTDEYGNSAGPEDVQHAVDADAAERFSASPEGQGAALYDAWPQIRDAGSLYGLKARGMWNQAALAERAARRQIIPGHPLYPIQRQGAVSPQNRLRAGLAGGDFNAYPEVR